MKDQDIKNIIENVLRSMNVDFEEVHIKGTQQRPRFVIKTGESNFLIGEKGKNLSALEFLVKRMVNKKNLGNFPFSLDVNDYHEKRLEGIKSDALKQASRAKLFKHDVELSPMTSYERMIIHSLFTNDPYIKTYSSGSGGYRHVVICYVG